MLMTGNAAKCRPFVSFVVPGEPVGKGRPRFTRTGRAYTPKKTETAESIVAMNAQLALRDAKPTDKPVVVEAIKDMTAKGMYPATGLWNK